MFIENFIEQAHQFEMIDERIAVNMRDKVKASINHSKMEIISLNGVVKSKIKQVTINTRKTQNKKTLANVKSEKKYKR